MRLSAVLATIFLIGAMVGAVSASAAGWSEVRLPGPAGKIDLLNVSCPSASFCVATGNQNLIASSTAPAGGASAWNVVYPGAGPFESESRGTFPTNSQLQGISCPTARLCVAVTNQGVVYSSTDPTGPASAWHVAELSPQGRNIHLYGVSCPSESLCVAVAGRRVSAGRVFTSTDPTGEAGAWQEAELGESLDLRAVSCASATLCVVVGADGEILASGDPSGGPGAWSTVGAPGGPGLLQSISCITGVCLTGDTGGNLLAATEPTSLPSWRESNGGGSVQITGSACASPTACLAVDSNGGVSVSTEPTGTHPGWARANLRPFGEGSDEPGAPAIGNALFGAACPTVSFCALVGSRGAILTSTEPFTTPTTAGASGGGGGSGPASRRPRSKIARLKLHGKGGGPFDDRPPRHIKLMMRFYAEGPVLRFECRLDHGAWRRCRSPHRYSGIGRGVHRVSVRAVGVTGLHGRPAFRRFYVGEICRRRARGLECQPGYGEIPPGWAFHGVGRRR